MEAPIGHARTCEDPRPAGGRQQAAPASIWQRLCDHTGGRLRLRVSLEIQTRGRINAV